VPGLHYLKMIAQKMRQVTEKSSVETNEGRCKINTGDVLLIAEAQH